MGLAPDRSAGRATPGPRPRLVLSRLPAPPLILGAVIIIGWAILAIDQPAYLLPSPVAVAQRLFELTFVTGELLDAFRLSLTALVLGAALAMFVGAPLGIAMGANRTVQEIFGPYVSGLYVAPVSALTPLFVWWFGIGLEPRVATVFVFSAPVIALTCYRGARETPRTLVEVARVFGASSRQVFTLTVIPNSIPYIVTALRLGLGRAIKGTVLAELVVSLTGLGLLLTGFSAAFDSASLLAVLFFLLIVGVVLQALIARIEVAIAPWRHP